jgi:pimeloyl-ACP methyl ester carboxylesterase
VLRLTGQPTLHWVGHSMGGILGYAHLASTRDRRLRGLVTLGSALDFTHGASAFQALVRHKHLIAHMPFVPVASIARLVARLVHLAPRLMAGFSYHPDNLEPDVARPYLAHTLCEVAPRELADLCSALEPGGLRCPRTDVPFSHSAGAITTPVLAVAGDDDHQCHPRDVAATLALLGSSDKTYLCVGRAQGSPAPFGHEDLVVGRYAASELWPELVRWLGQH